MWVFGYGSLMWDGWEAGYDCVRRVVATLPGFRRVFNKASVKNWGTRENPGPTLNVVADSSASCTGFAFEFPEQQGSKVLAYLKQWEGKGFRFDGRRVRLDESGTWVEAMVPIYSGGNVLIGKTTGQLARMARLAAGTKGPSIDYVRNVAAKLSRLEIDDAAVEEFFTAIEQDGADRRPGDTGTFR
jgi:glutathione-specific gamma-glutamylcyclotransferase